MSPAWAGRFFTTAPLGKPLEEVTMVNFICQLNFAKGCPDVW